MKAFFLLTTLLIAVFAAILTYAIYTCGVDVILIPIVMPMIYFGMIIAILYNDLKQEIQK